MTVPTSSDDEALILASIDRFLERDVAPYAHELEATDTYPQAIVDFPGAALPMSSTKSRYTRHPFRFWMPGMQARSSDTMLDEPLLFKGNDFALTDIVVYSSQ